MQQCMKSDISSTQGNRAVVPACTGTGTRVCWSGAGLGPGRGGDCREGCLIARWFAGTAPGATWVVDGDVCVGGGYTMLAGGGRC